MRARSTNASGHLSYFPHFISRRYGHHSSFTWYTTYQPKGEEDPGFPRKHRWQNGVLSHGSDEEGSGGEECASVDSTKFSRNRTMSGATLTGSPHMSLEFKDDNDKCQEGRMSGDTIVTEMRSVSNDSTAPSELPSDLNLSDSPASLLGGGPKVLLSTPTSPKIPTNEEIMKKDPSWRFHASILLVRVTALDLRGWDEFGDEKPWGKKNGKLNPEHNEFCVKMKVRLGALVDSLYDRGVTGVWSSEILKREDRVREAIYRIIQMLESCRTEKDLKQSLKYLEAYLKYMEQLTRLKPQ